uniref:Uncharacterized protein n=1 Tax=uncultured prokaryote TaxID=198431 RepID=A0A0H5Q6V0_9ZZZZ|nr:hypothetical protein [uncultured prokaryote]
MSSDLEEWIDRERDVVELLADELEELDEKLKAEIRVLEHHRRHIYHRFKEIADDGGRIHKFTASALRDRLKEVRAATKAAKEVTALFDQFGDEMERDAERLVRLRKRYE